MPNHIVSGNVDTMMRAADNAAIRSAIGVGTTDAPTFARLTCSATGPGGITVINSNGSIGGFILSAGAPGVFNAGFAIYDNTLLVNRLYISSSGNVGIGNTSTIEKLDVTGTIRASAGYHSINGYTDTSNYDRGVFTFVSNTLRIGTENIGAAYPLARPIDFVTGGVVRMALNATDALFSGFIKSTSGIFNSGGSGFILGLDTNYNTGIRLQSFTDSILLIRNVAGTDLARVCLGGTTSAFPAIKRNGTGIDIRLADDSLFTNLSCKNVIQSPGVGTTVTPASNGDLVFETTSNTSVTLKLKGSDGTVRSVALTLA